MACEQPAKRSTLSLGRFSGRAPLVVFLVLALAIGVTGYVVFAHLKEAIRQDRSDEISAIADLKLSQIERWREERLADGTAVASDPLLADAVRRWLERGAPQDEAGRRIRFRLAALREAFGYDMAMLFDRRAQAVLVAGDAEHLHAHADNSLADEAMSAARPVLSDLHLEADAPTVANIDLYAPLIGDGGRVVGAIYFQINPFRFLYPFIQSWPTPSESAETLLVRRDGDDVLFLNELRHRKDSALKFRLPADRADLLAAMALRGTTGVVEGIDYRGVPVLAALRSVPGSSWRMVAKIDQAEVFAPVQNLAAGAGLLVAMFIGSAGVAVGFWWREQRARVFAGHLQAELERQALAAHFDYLSRYANDIILLMDEDGRIVEANDAAVTAYGYSREQLLQMHSRELRASVALSSFEADQARIAAHGRLIYETVEKRSDGSTFPIESSIRVIEVEGKRYRQAIIRDISERKQAEESIRESEERFRAAFEQAGVGMALRDIDPRKPRWLRVNQKLCDILGYTREELLQLSSVDVTPPEERQVAIDYNEKLLRGEITSYSREKRYVRKDGRIIWANISLSPVSGPDGRPTHLISVIQDITERKDQEQKIIRLSRIHAVMSSINSMIVRARDRRKLFNEACRIAVEHGGFVMAWIGSFDAATQDVTPVAKAGRDDGYLDQIKLTARNDVTGNSNLTAEALTRLAPAVCNDISVDERMRRWRDKALKCGYRSVALFPLLIERRPVGVFVLYAAEPGFFDDQEMKLLVEMADDISFALDHIATEEKLNYLAYYDALTGLPNRALFDDRMAQRLRVASREQSTVALVLFDLERFRMINDTLGRQMGDRLLKLVAERLQGVIFDRDNLARVQAGVFAALFSDIEEETDVAHIVEEKIIACLGRPFTLDGQEVRVAAKAGVALYPGDGTEPDALFSSAEAALQQAKGASERFVFYERNMNARVAERLKLENKLERALEREEFVLYYQPKVDLRTGRVTGLEALMRWNDPDTGLVPPQTFIPVLEETGMIVAAGAWAMKQAVSQYAAWRAAGLHPPRIAVNVSQVQLKRKDFIATVLHAVAAAGNPKHGLDIEITESMIMDDIEANIEKLTLVRGLGVGIAIDDFGTGYSSLRYLARLPVTALKIDRAFVRDVTTNEDNMAIVSTVITLAHNMKLTVVAEGVETEEQRDLLKMLKCDVMQGYLFSKPVPADEVPALLARGGKGAAS